MSGGARPEKPPGARPAEAKPAKPGRRVGAELLAHGTATFGRLRVLTRDWQRGMVPGQGGRRAALVAWIVLMTLLGGWWALSWLATDLVTGWEAAIQRLLARSPENALWWQCGDTVFHILTMLLLVCTLELGRWLFRPRWRRWVPIAVGLAIGVGDELLQAFSPVRHCDWRDLLSDAVGALLAGGLLWLLVRRARGAPVVEEPGMFTDAMRPAVRLPGEKR